MKRTAYSILAVVGAFALASSAFCQNADAPPNAGPPQQDAKPIGPGAPRGPGKPGGWGGVREERKLVARFDRDGDQRLNAAERKAAREFLATQRAAGRNRSWGPPRTGLGENAVPPQPGPKLSPGDVPSLVDAPLYAPNALRTLFLQFENADWEEELADFKDTDVEVPAKLTVDGKTYPDVGIHFRGMSSYRMVSEGRKRSLNLWLDWAHKDQRLLGYSSLHLLNSHTDPTCLRSVLYYQVAREFVPAPKANYVRVVINGESWGVYVNQQPFNKDFVQEWFGTTKGARWKVPGNPRGDGGLRYLDDDVAAYQRLYEIKTKDDPKSWAALIRLCEVLNYTPTDQLEEKLAALLDIDGALKYLALDNVFINNDGYWIRASDYSLYRDEKGRFHLIPQDDNETFRIPGGPGWGGRQSVKGVELDPLAGANDSTKPLLQRLLAVPSLRTRYLGYVRAITEQWLDWNKLEPLAHQYQGLIAADVKSDTRKLDSFEAFTKGLTEDTEEQGLHGSQRNISLKNFVEQRRTFLLSLPALKVAAKEN